MGDPFWEGSAGILAGLADDEGLFSFINLHHAPGLAGRDVWAALTLNRSSIPEKLFVACEVLNIKSARKEHIQRD